MQIKKTIISIAIAIIFTLFIGYGIEVFDDSPEREEYCPKVYDLETKEECESADGIWTEEKYYEDNIPRPVKSFCQEKRECYELFNQARTSHDKVVFIAAALFGLLAIVIGIVIKITSVSAGLVGGGVLLILYGTIRYWEHANDVLKFILLGVVLVVLIWISYKKLEKK
jgi:predicted nucleic acid-binding Zn ribbon protein